MPTYHWNGDKERTSAYQRRVPQVRFISSRRTLCLLSLLILGALLADCGAQETQVTVGATLATFTATAPRPVTPTAPPPTVAPSPTREATATSVPVPPTTAATPPSAASPIATQSQPPPGTPMTVEVRIINFAFDPATVTVPVGTTVVWRNTDGFHTVLSGDFMLDSPALDVGGTYAFTFTQPGEFHYICGIHPEMLGIVNVVP